MYVHIFARVSSGACSNYALKITAVENKEKFGKEAAQTSKNNFYVDDQLKSVANKVQVIKKVAGMCHEGGFNLTKFTSSSKRVLQSIPEKDRGSSVKGKDLVKNLAEDQVLGVLWNNEDDAFGFKVALKSKPMTRRGVSSVLGSAYDPLGFGAPFLLKRKQILQKLYEQGENSHDSQWFYVNTKANPADYCSRGIDVNNTKATETWFSGSSFL